MVTDHVQEGLHLELKTKRFKTSADGQLIDTDRWQWQFSRALSGFANSDGGVLVWGVETDDDERASALAPILEVARFEARLKKSLLEAVEPFVDGVRVESILGDDGSGGGFIKILIPRSDKTPHRAPLADREYYRRSTEGFYRMEHFDLEDAFGRRPHPVLSVDVQYDPRLVSGDPYEEVRLFFRNQGRGIARYIGAVCTFSPDVRIERVSDKWHNNTALNRGPPVATYANNDGVIHPTSDAIAIGSILVERAAKDSPLEFRVRLYCEGMLART